MIFRFKFKYKAILLIKIKYSSWYIIDWRKVCTTINLLILQAKQLKKRNKNI